MLHILNVCLQAIRSTPFSKYHITEIWSSATRLATRLCVSACTAGFQSTGHAAWHVRVPQKRRVNGVSSCMRYTAAVNLQTKCSFVDTR